MPSVMRLGNADKDTDNPRHELEIIQRSARIRWVQLPPPPPTSLPHRRAFGLFSFQRTAGFGASGTISARSLGQTREEGTTLRTESRNGLLKVIAVFKLLKSLLLVGVGLGALQLLDASTAARVERWAWALALRLGPRAASSLENGLSHLHESRLLWVAVFAFAYAALFGVEGVGLWMEKRWAEYLTIVATSSFVPFELYELSRRMSWPRMATLAVNLLVVGYLIWKVRENGKRPSR